MTHDLDRARCRAFQWCRVIGPVWTRFAAFRDPVTPLPAPDACLARCAICAGDLDGEHTHLVAKRTSASVCVCHTCCHVFFLVTNGRSHHTDEPHYCYFPVLRTDVTEDGLNLPVGLTFVFSTAVEDRLVTWTPTPGGAIETSLPDSTWTALLAANPGVDTMRPLRDALLLRRTPRAEDSGLLIPSHVCFDLIGTVRSGCHNTLSHLQRLNDAMEDLWAWATAMAPGAPRHLDAPQT